MVGSVLIGCKQSVLNVKCIRHPLVIMLGATDTNQLKTYLSSNLLGNYYGGESEVRHCECLGRRPDVFATFSHTRGLLKHLIYKSLSWDGGIMNNEEVYNKKLETINVLSTVYQRIMSVNKDYDEDTKTLLKVLEDKIKSNIEALN